MPHAYRFVLHDRDSIYASGLDATVTAMGVRILRTPVRAPRQMRIVSTCSAAYVASAWTP